MVPVTFTWATGKIAGLFDATRNGGTPPVIVSDVGVFENATILGGTMLTAAGFGGTGLKGLFGAPLPPPQPPRNASPVNAKHVKIQRSERAAK